MNWKKFTIKLILWLIFVAVIPIIAIVDRYDLVKNSPLKYTGWGIIVIAIITIVLMVMLGYVLKLMKWSMFKQIVSGVRNVIIPLCLLYIGSGLIANNVENIKFILIVTIISEFAGIIVNPFPKYIYEKNLSDIKEALK